MLELWKTWRAMRMLKRVRFFVWRTAAPVDAVVEEFIAKHLDKPSTGALAPVVRIYGGAR